MIIHQAINVDVNSLNTAGIQAIANVNDKGTRFVDAAFYASGTALDLSDCTAYAIFVIKQGERNILINDHVTCTISSNVVSIPIDTVNQSGVLKIQVVFTTTKNTSILQQPIELYVQLTDSIANTAQVIPSSLGVLAQIISEIAEARGDYDNLNQRLNDLIPDDQGVITTFNLADGAVTTAIIENGAVTLDKLAKDLATIINNKANKSSTLAGYGIVNAYTKTEMLNLLANKADVATTLEGYGITNAYTREKTNELLATKYDSSNIELGTATLTPYSTQVDKVKSATCLYEKIGDIVIVNVTVIMNATSLGGTSAISLLNMPFSNKSDVIVHDIGVSKNGGMFRGSVSKSAWLQFTPLNKQAYDFVADEQVNFSLIYKIK